MASTVEFLTNPKSNKRFALITIAQTSVGTGTEETINDPRLEGVWKMHRIQADLASGSGSSISPIFGWQASPAGSHKVGYQARATAAQVDEQPAVPPVFPIPSGGSLYYNPNVDGSSDNVVNSSLLIEEV